MLAETPGDSRSRCGRSGTKPGITYESLIDHNIAMGFVLEESILD